VHNCSCGIAGEVCSAAGKCSDVSMYTDNKPSGGICVGGACMIHLRGVSTVLGTETPVSNLTLWQCI
jgi:hypothetical protein